MHRSPIPRRVLVAACALLAACAPRYSQVEVAAESARSRPNVLLILVDDLRPELGAYGVERAITPNFDRLASQGLLFERAYTQQAVCAPSRATLLTGLRPDSTGIYDLRTPVRTVLPAHVTLPQHFRNHGYSTRAIGKVYHHPTDDPQGWSEGPIIPRVGVGRGYLSEEAARAVAAYEAEHQDGSGRGPSYEAPAVHDTAYQDGKIANRAIEHLSRQTDQPFFLAVGFAKPHLPFNAPKQYWDLYPPERIRLPENYGQRPKGAPEFSLVNFGELRNYTDIPRRGPVPDEKAHALVRGYLASTSYVDAQIGRVLDELERLGLDDNTVVVLWGDHGYKLGEYGEWVKHTNFEIDTRVPLVVRTPGMTTAGRRTGALVETVDLYATLAELAGLPAPAHQGLSLVPLIRDPTRAWKTAAFSQYPRRGDVMGRSIRTDRYHYIEWQRRDTGDVLARELYDHRLDPGENVNVAEAPRHADTLRELSARLAAGWRGALPDGS